MPVMTDKDCPVPLPDSTSTPPEQRRSMTARLQALEVDAFFFNTMKTDVPALSLKVRIPQGPGRLIRCCAATCLLAGLTNGK